MSDITCVLFLRKASVFSPLAHSSSFIATKLWKVFTKMLGVFGPKVPTVIKGSQHYPF